MDTRAPIISNDVRRLSRVKPETEIDLFPMPLDGVAMPEG